MKPDKTRLKYLYQSVVEPYEKKIKSKWKWEKGEKERVVQNYIMFCEAAGVRDLERIDEMIQEYLKFATKRANQWVTWQHAERRNYLGFVLNRDEAKIAGSKMNQDNAPKANDLNIAGTQTSEHWDF